MVVATTIATAKDAAELVAIDYEPLPAVTDAAAATTPGASRIWNGAASNLCIDAVVGDPAKTEAAFANAAHVVKLATLVQRVTGVPMEPRALRSTPAAARRCARSMISPACSTCRPSACAS